MHGANVSEKKDLPVVAEAPKGKRFMSPVVVLILPSFSYFAYMKKVEYVRDRRSPAPKDENVSKVMSANKAKNTKPEILLRKALWQNGLRGYRLSYKKVPGRPDIAFVSKKIAIFVNGCFWHRCPYCKLSIPKNNTSFWQEKFERNRARDKRKNIELREAGWKSLIIWECQIQKDTRGQIKKIRNLFHNENLI